MTTGEGAHKVENTAGQASLDGQGGTDLISQTKSEHRNIYYRLFTKEGPLESNNPIFSNDRFISCISSKSVGPPHTAASLKRYICKIEGVEGPEKGALYLSLSEKKPLDDSARLALRGNPGPGSSEVDPVIFVVDKGTAEERPKSASGAGLNELCEQRYDRLVHVEAVSGHDVQLLENEDGEITLNDGDAIALLTDNFPRSKEDRPIVFKYAQNALGQGNEGKMAELSITETQMDEVDGSSSSEGEGKPKGTMGHLEITPSDMDRLDGGSSHDNETWAAFRAWKNELDAAALKFKSL